MPGTVARTRLLPLLVVLLPSWATTVQALEAVVLRDGDAEVRIGRRVAFFEDPRASETFESLPDLGRWAPSRSDTLNFGISPSAWWVRFEVRNETSEQDSWILEADWAITDSIELHEAEADGAVRVRRSGDRLPFESWEVPHRNPAFRLALAPGASETVTLRLAAGDALLVPLVLWTPEAFANKTARENWGFGFYFGILFILILSNLLNYFTLRDASHLYYVLTLASFTVWNLCIWGFAYQHLWPDEPGFSNMIINLLPVAGGVAFIALTRNVLVTRIRARLLDRILGGLAWGGTAVGLLALTLLSVTHALLIAGPIFLAIFATSLTAAVRAWRQGWQPARDYLIAWSTIFAVMAVWIADVRFGLFETDVIVRYGIQFAFVVTASLLSWALANRVRLLTEERDRSFALMQASRRLARYFPRKLVDRIMSDKEHISLASKRRNITIFFSDLTGFTDFTDENEPERVTAMLNDYLSAMARLVEEHGGTLHQIIGDGIMALFGAPDSAPAQEQAERAVRMAVAMQREVARLGERWRESGLDHHIRVRMGIHQDYATVGNFGSEHLMSYAAIGAAVNLASRLESACRPGCILVSYPIYALTRHEHRYGPLVEREFKGFTRLFKVAELDPGVAFGEDRPVRVVQPTH
jgi:adenylate cyclase